MDRAEEITQELRAACESLGMPVDIDRRLDIGKEDLPLVVIRTGEEESAPVEGAPNLIWDRRWIMRPEIEIYIREPRTSEQRARLAGLWAQFRAAMSDSRILDLIADNSMPEMKRIQIQVDDAADVAGLLIELGLTFDR